MTGVMYLNFSCMLVKSNALWFLLVFSPFFHNVSYYIQKEHIAAHVFFFFFWPFCLHIYLIIVMCPNFTFLFLNCWLFK